MRKLPKLYDGRRMTGYWKRGRDGWGLSRFHGIPEKHTLSLVYVNSVITLQVMARLSPKPSPPPPPKKKRGRVRGYTTSSVENSYSMGGRQF